MMHLLVLVVEQSHKRFPVAADCESNMLDPVCLTPSPNKKNSLKCVCFFDESIIKHTLPNK